MYNNRFIIKGLVGLILTACASTGSVNKTPSNKNNNSHVQTTEHACQKSVPSVINHTRIERDNLSSEALGANSNHALSEDQKLQIEKLTGKMVNIPAGCFQMGNNGGAADESPLHWVSVPAFELGQHEVTYAQWQACVRDGGCKIKPYELNLEQGNQPIVFVNWHDVTEQFIPWINQKTGRNYRLPTEAEWEYAARAGSTTKYHFGDDEKRLCDYANVNGSNRSTDYSWRIETCNDDYGKKVVNVKSFQPNQFGLYDMYGNVWEMVEDCWNFGYDDAPDDGSSWQENNCDRTVVRGGSWMDKIGSVRSANRNWVKRTARVKTTGFRLAHD